jgi:hypothetical protein
MATYLNLGPRKLTGLLDQTGNNPGNWTVRFDQAVFPDVPYFEVYKMLINGAPNSTFDMFIGAAQWEQNQRGDINTWNGVQQLTPGTELYFYWSDSTADDNPPTVTLWLRYDTSIPQNQVGYRA